MDLIPRSGLAYFCIGIFVSYGLGEWIVYPIFAFPLLPVFFLFFSICLVYSFLYFLHSKNLICFRRNFRYILWGLALGLIIFWIQDWRILKLQKQVYGLLELHSNFNLTPIRKIQGRIWLFHITTPTSKETYPILVQIYKNKPIQSFNCNKDSIIKVNLPSHHFAEKVYKVYGGLLFSLKNCKNLKDTPLPILVRREVYEKLKQGNIQAEMAGVAMALIFGESSYLSENVYDNSKKTGTLHLFAASGLHIGIFMGSLYLIGKYGFKLGYYLGFVFPLILSFFYLYILSFPISLTRAYLFALLFVSSKLLFRKIRPIDLIVITSCFVLIFKRESFLSIGFLLSYLAVIGIFFIKPRLDNMITTPSHLHTIRDNFTLTLSANLGTFPIVYYYFEGFSYGSVLSNFILVPLAGILLPCLYLSVILSFLLPNYLDWIIKLLWTTTDFLIRILLFLVDYFSQSISFYREWIQRGLDLFFLFGILLLIFIAYYIKQNKLFKEDFILKLNNFLVIKFFLIYICWMVIGYNIHKPNKLESANGIYYLSNYSYVVVLDEKIGIGGTCKYDSYEISKILTKELCQQKKIIYIEHESCMHLIKKCFVMNENLFLELGSRYLKDWLDTLPLSQSKIVTKNSIYEFNGLKIFFYKLGVDPPWLPKFLAKKYGYDRIIIQNPKNLPIQKTLGGWNENKIVTIENNGISFLQPKNHPGSPW